jgi:tetratricopeptide (TPR) repeat protein
MQHDDVLIELFRQSKRDVISREDLFALEGALDSAIRTAARFDFNSASITLVNTLIALQLFSSNKDTQRLQARCLTELGNIRRDQGNIAGHDGALGLYHRAKQLWEFLKDRARIAHCELCIGICHEMQRNYAEALKHLKRGEEAAGTSSSLITLLGTILLRRGALLTKIGALDEAETGLKRSLTLLEGRLPEMNVASAKVKLATLYLSKGEFEKAYHIVEDSMQIIGTEEKMRFTQTHILLANIMFNMREIDAGLEAASKAEATANRFGFHHQLNSLNKIVETHGLALIPQRTLTKKMFDIWQNEQALLMYKQLYNNMGVEELRIICKECQISFDTLFGDNYEEKVRSVIIRAQLMDRFSELQLAINRLLEAVS